VNIPPDGELGGPVELKRDRSFYVYKGYERYFERERFYPKKYKGQNLSRYGQGYLVYLPEAYGAQPEKEWPLILFLCGSGDRGPNVFLFAKNGRFQMIREKAPLPFIIVAPMLDLSSEFRSFPDAYLDGVMAEIEKEYRVDTTRRYLTGLSMGGEATYRYALHRPEAFAAIAPLAAFDARFSPGAIADGFAPFAEDPGLKGRAGAGDPRRRRHGRIQRPQGPRPRLAGRASGLSPDIRGIPNAQRVSPVKNRLDLQLGGSAPEALYLRYRDQHALALAAGPE
jgi:hypothetical protein